MEHELSKYIRSESVELLRSQIHFADYNPRTLDEESKKSLKRGIKKFGLLGGVIVNKATNYTIVSGHQRITVMDELQKYDPQTKENDYKVRVDLINVDIKMEKELNILLNNPNAQGRWDYEKLAQIIPDIDYKDAGLTDADLNMIGVDYLLQTEEENNIADALDDLMSPIIEEREEAKAERAAERAAEKAMQQEMEREAKVQHMKDVKQQVREAAISKAEEMDAYVMLSFSSWSAKAEFCERFGYPAEMKIIKGEVFAEQVERID